MWQISTSTCLIIIRKPKTSLPGSYVKAKQHEYSSINSQSTSLTSKPSDCKYRTTETEQKQPNHIPKDETTSPTCASFTGLSCLSAFCASALFSAPISPLYTLSCLLVPVAMSPAVATLAQVESFLPDSNLLGSWSAFVTTLRRPHDGIFQFLLASCSLLAWGISDLACICYLAGCFWCCP